VLGGVAFSFVPGLPQVDLRPGLVFLVFLPPLLYWEAITAPTDEMWANAKAICSLAGGLVIGSTVAVAVVAHALVPGLPWAGAFVLGAIVAPTDASAVSQFAQRLGLPRRTLAIVGGESLLNDAGALVLYGVAVTAAVSGSFSLADEGLRFLWAGPCAVGIGLLVGWMVTQAWKGLRDSHLQTAISVLTPFLAYLPAQQLGLSGVLAVVTTGVFVNRTTPLVLTAEARQRARGFWETIVFLINTIMFLLVGLQLHDITGEYFHYPPATLAGYTLAITATIVGLRIAWVFGQGYAARLIPRRTGTQRDDGGGWRHRTVIAWSGLRGGVSLAAALAIPKTIAGGAPFPERDLIIFLAFGVVLVTLIGQGLTLPRLIARLGLKDDGADAHDEHLALAAMAEAVRGHLNDLERDGKIAPESAQHLRTWCANGNRRFTFRGRAATRAQDEVEARHHETMRELLKRQRESLVQARERGEIDNTVLRRVQTFLDMEELELDRLGVSERRRRCDSVQ
jgi:Na+/H+ antiporter